jgi:hypothetical protein
VRDGKVYESDLLDKLPDDATLEGIRYRIYVQQRVDEGRVLTQEGVEERMAKWLDG